MSGVNKTISIGRLGADPELRFTSGGKPVCNFRVAVDSQWKDRDGQKQKHTEWLTIVVWGPQAEACGKHLAKGREVYVEGEIRTRSYEKDGDKRYVTEIVARDVRFLGGNKSDGGQRRDDAPEDMGEF